MGWELFKNYVIARDKFKPDFFLYENNKSMSAAIREQITRELGVEPVLINSALVSAQSRQRLYWVGKRNHDGTYSQVKVEQPEDRGILLRDVLDKGVAWNEKSYCITATEYKGSNPVQTITKHRRTMVAESVRIGTIESGTKTKHDSKPFRVYSPDAKAVTIQGEAGGYGAKTGLYATPIDPVRVGTMPNKTGSVINSQGRRIYAIDGKAHSICASQSGGNSDISAPSTRLCAEPVCESRNAKSMTVYEVKDNLITIKEKQYPIKLTDGFYIIRKLTVNECKRLQTVPEWYFTPHIFRLKEVFLVCKSVPLMAVKIPLQVKKQGCAINITFDLKDMELLNCNENWSTKLKSVSWMAVKEISKPIWDIALCTIRDLDGQGLHDLREAIKIISRATTNIDLSIEKSRQKCSEEILKETKLSTILTLIHTITTHLTSMCVQTQSTQVFIENSEGNCLDTSQTSLTLDILYSTEKSMSLVSNSACYKMLGNGWTIDVIVHLLSHMDGITSEPLEVFSMYDGMSCGHIALDKLGANVAAYYATEIDKYAIKTTMANYPETIQLGDAFQVREENWELPVA